MNYLIVGMTLLGMGLLPPAESVFERPAVNQPTAEVERVEATKTIEGRASWYDYVPGGAAAGPRLRTMLGKDWRGQKVTVCVGDTCVRVKLSDWCQCYKGERRERIIDLDVRSFGELAPTWKGLVAVTVKSG